MSKEVVNMKSNQFYVKSLKDEEEFLTSNQELISNIRDMMKDIRKFSEMAWICEGDAKDYRAACHMGIRERLDIMEICLKDIRD